MMKKNKDGPISLKWGLSFLVALCWLIPILVVVTVSGYLLSNNYESHVRHNMETGTEHAMKQVELRFDSAVEASKAASYEGVIQQAYREYCRDGNHIQLYSDVTDYLSRSYSRDKNLKAVFVTFLSQPDVDYSYVVNKSDSSYEILSTYREQAREALLEVARDMDTGIAFRFLDGELYMVRNLMDIRFRPYAVLTMLCDREVLFQSLDAVASLDASRITVDDTVIPLLGEGKVEAGDLHTSYTVQISGHSLTFEASGRVEKLWGAMPQVRLAVAIVTLLVVPLVFVAVMLFYHQVTRPVELLVDASNKVESGLRGYQIGQTPKTQEFRKLVRHFNSMSKELKSQFERLYLEQQSLQEARIKALQSQINPHFLGNTLEIINWEARIAEDEKVSAMIEALSTMLDAAIGRDGRSLITLREELTYTDAYLYIIQQRMGPGLKVTKEIDESLLALTVPRLMLQPVVENAVDHDISQRRGSELAIRIYSREDFLYTDVEHEGTITPEDQEKIRRLLTLSPEKLSQRGSVGIRNLSQRLKLICGPEAELTIREYVPGRILARIRLPLHSLGSAGREVCN